MRGVKWVAVALNWLWMQMPVRRAALAQEKKKRILRAAEHLRRLAVSVAQAKRWEDLAHRRAEVMARAADDLDAGGGARLTAAILRIHANVLPPEPKPATLHLGETPPQSQPFLVQYRTLDGVWHDLQVDALRCAWFGDPQGEPTHVQAGWSPEGVPLTPEPEPAVPVEPDTRPRCRGCGSLASLVADSEDTCVQCGLRCLTEMGPALEPNSEGYFVEVKTAAGWKLLTVNPFATKEEAEQHMNLIHGYSPVLRVAGRPRAACSHVVIDPCTLKCQGCGASKSDIDNVPLAERPDKIAAESDDARQSAKPADGTAPSPEQGRYVTFRCTAPTCSFNYSPPDCPICGGTGWQRAKLDPITTGDVWAARNLLESSPKFFAKVASSAFSAASCRTEVEVEYANGDRLLLTEEEFRDRFRLFEKKGV